MKLQNCICTKLRTNKYIIIIIIIIIIIKYIYIAQVCRKNATNALEFAVACQTEKISVYSWTRP